MDINLNQETAVSVVNAYKRYTPTAIVLNGLNMSVREGSIYALLGPSGCGKTTLLRSLMGRVQLDSGEVYVKAKRLCNVGYMPQEIALHMDMTITETFNFYGRLFSMKWVKIQTRGTDLLKFLDLPEPSRKVADLSGGQQRRVSFAVALLHDPQLLILDEPTVGVDPVLSNSIWLRLLKMADVQKKTIIITTHYIEEARQAHMIGLMRNGVLLAEESPTQLMLKQNCSNLEQAFLQLSEKQQLSQQEKLQEIQDYPCCDMPPPSPLLSEKSWRVERFFAQLMRNLVWNMRNVNMLIYILALPALQAYLCNMILGSEPQFLKVGILSEELHNGMADCNVSAPQLNCSDIGQPLSCWFMDQLRDRALSVEEYRDLEVAKEAIREGKIWCVLHFAENYTSSLFGRLEMGQSTDDGTIDSSIVNVWMDMSNLWMMSLLKRDIVYSLVSLLKNLLTICNYSPKLAETPVRFEQPIYGLKQPKFIHFTAPGLIMSFCFYLPIMFTTGAIMMERSEGLLERSLTAGMTILEVVAAHTVIQLIYMVAQSTIVLVIFYVVYYNPFVGNFYLVLLLLFMVELMGMTYAFMLSMYFDTEKLATYAGVGTIVVMFIVCGIVWPYQGMYGFLKYLIWFSPVQPAVEAHRAVAERAWDLSYSVVYLGFLSTAVWTILFAWAANSIARRKKIGL